MLVLDWTGFAAGLLLVLLTGVSVVETTVVPRSNQTRITRMVQRLVSVPVRTLLDHIRDYERRDRLHAVASATYVVVTLVVWLLLFLIGYSLLLVPFSDSLGGAVVIAGSSMLTLGIAAPRAGPPTGIVFAAALTGLVVITLQIAYLPVLYAAYNRRETLVTVLEGVAGTPGWGPEILLRSEVIDNLDGLGPLYGRWMEWAADVSESHTAYPALLHFRSPTSQRSWVVSLLSILDAAAMHLALRPVTAPAEARNLMRVGYLAFRQLAGVIGHPVPEDPNPDDPIRLSLDEFLVAAEMLRAAGLTFDREPEAAWVHFKGWRVNYEAAAYALAAELDAVPARWSGTRHRPGPMVEPLRPVDRVSPTAEVTEIRRVSELRRLRRAALNSPGRAAHTAPPEPSPRTPPGDDAGAQPDGSS